MLIIFMVSTNVLLWTFSQNAIYTQAAKDENQKSADRLNENIVASGGNYSVSGDEVTVKTTLTNAGSVAVQIMNLWVFDTYPTNQRYTNKSLNLNLNPGEVLELRGFSSLTVTIPGANASHGFVSWFVTARGNTIPLETASGIIIAELAQGIGSISMEFKIRHYIVEDGVLGPAEFDFTIPAGETTVFGITLTNLDESKMDINLTGHSCVWLIVPGTSASAYWSIAKVVDGTLSPPFDFQVLEYGKPTLLFFGGTDPPNSLQGRIAAVNILLYGKIGPNDYGQNIPFAAVYVE